MEAGADEVCRTWSLLGNFPVENKARYSEKELLLHTGAASAGALKAPCAMVPLNPNELRRDVEREPMRFVSTRAAASTGAWNDAMIDRRCAFSLRRAVEAS